MQEEIMFKNSSKALFGRILLESKVHGWEKMKLSSALIKVKSKDEMTELWGSIQ